jgi:ADP-ribose pyrophosphatase YjhB (NUDIX family)
MKKTTLCLLIKEGEVLLAMKKRGFGVGKWNGVGGKVQDGEDIKTATIREVKEEIGVDIDINNLKRVATIQFSFTDNPTWNNECHIFTAATWQGDPLETEEMRPQWYSIAKLPFESMWVDDPQWLPRVLAGERVEGKFLFANGGSAILESSILPFNEKEAPLVFP